MIIDSEGSDECEFESTTHSINKVNKKEPVHESPVTSIMSKGKLNNDYVSRGDLQVIDSLQQTKKRVLSPAKNNASIGITTVDKNKRLKNINEEESLVSESAKYEKTSQNQSNSSQSSLKEWYCEACTYLNGKRAQRCDMCGR